MTSGGATGEPQTSLARFFEGVVRLGADVEFALVGITEVLRAAPTHSGLGTEDRANILTGGAMSEAGLRAAEAAVASGAFAYDLVDQFVIGLASSLADDQCRDLLAVNQAHLNRLYEDGFLIGRSTGDATSTPGWLFDTSQNDGLIPHVSDILAEDAPYFFLTFGRAVYHVRESLVIHAPIPPERWLTQGRDPAAVVAAIKDLPESRRNAKF